MDVRQLRYALALAEHQHFGRAAAAVGIAQPPLSKAIAQLEGEVGARLFDRTRQGVFPTAAGDALLARARRIDQELTAAALDAQRAAREKPAACASVSSAPRCCRCCRRCCADSGPTTGGAATAAGDGDVESSRALVAGELDVIICRGAPRGRGVQQLVSVAVSRDYLIGVVSTSHPFAGQQRMSLDQLRRQPLVIARPEMNRPSSRRCATCFRTEVHGPASPTQVTRRPSWGWRRAGSASVWARRTCALPHARIPGWSIFVRRSPCPA